MCTDNGTLRTVATIKCRRRRRCCRREKLFCKIEKEKKRNCLKQFWKNDMYSLNDLDHFTGTSHQKKPNHQHEEKFVRLFVQQQQKPFPFVSAITRGEREKTHPINMLRFFVVSSNAKNTLDRGEHLKHFLVIFNQRVVYFFTISSHSNRSNGVLRQTRAFFFVFEGERNGKTNIFTI